MFLAASRSAVREKKRLLRMSGSVGWSNKNRQLPTLQLYLLVSHRERRVETRERTGEGNWVERIAGKGGSIRLAAVGIELTVDEIYDLSPLTSSL